MTSTHASVRCSIVVFTDIRESTFKRNRPSFAVLMVLGGGGETERERDSGQDEGVIGRTTDSLGKVKASEIKKHKSVPSIKKIKFRRKSRLKKIRFRLQRARRSGIFTHFSSLQDEGGKLGHLSTHSQGENPNGIGE